MKDAYLDQLEKAFDYAARTGSFDKRNIIENAKHVCVFGLGKYFEEAFIQQNVAERFQVTILSDNNKERLVQISSRDGMKEYSCLAPEALPEGTVVILMLGDPRKAEKQLDSLGILHMTYNDLALDGVMNQPRSSEWFLKQQSRIFEAFSLFEGESRKIYVNIFCNRVAPHLAGYSYEDMCTEPQYFPRDLFSLDNDECFLDCGAYDGDTLQQFVEMKGNGFCKYYAMELDAKNFARLELNIASLEKETMEKCLCYPYGVWNESSFITYGKMSSSDSFSVFNTRDIHEAQVVKIDDLFAEKRITFIKMDIEGAEREALEGASKVIKAQSPKMAICVYHKLNDLWEIPLYLKNLVSDYRLELRHHANFYVSETVCYAAAGNE